MLSRIALAALLPLSAAAQAPPMFSPWYGEALRGILTLEDADIALLERKLAANAEDFPTRLKLIAYHRRADRAKLPEALAKRAQHVRWLIERHPDSELLHSYVARFSRGELPAADERRNVELWEAAVKTGNAAIAWNAANYFEDLDASLHLHYLEATVAADPNHPFALRPLAALYAAAALERGPRSARAVAALDASRNVWVLGNAAHLLYLRGSAALAEKYFLRAKALDPNLEREKILPPMEARAAAPAVDAQARFDAATVQIRRLPVSAFPELPPVVASVLIARKCTIPQPYTGGAPGNVIHGAFFAKGERGWAVLCSVGEQSTVLVFRNDRDAKPEELAKNDDRHYLQGIGGDQIGYSRQISAANRSFILSHYRAYGGPAPPPIDHDGVDDAFVGKASATWYHYEGKWVTLAGAD
jgi:tetratricopeptide (TPR) repeat protein